jgi:beta-N-acetylglucosaminidase
MLLYIKKHQARQFGVWLIGSMCAVIMSFSIKVPIHAATETITADIAAFPASYHSALTALKQAHPNWIFVPQEIGLDFQTVLENEMVHNRSLVPNTLPSYMQNGSSNESAWSQASEGILRYYLDPRNALTQDAIFQFELLTYDATNHSEEAIQRFLNNTFMAGKLPASNQTYANAFATIGASVNVSSFHLASRVFQEQGEGNSRFIDGNTTTSWIANYFRNTTGFLVNGAYQGHEPLYNYFNIGATGQGDEAVVVNGLRRAYEAGWTTPYASLEGGARFISQNYIACGQDTLYLQKFDVDQSDGSLYFHQYMQSIIAPTLEAKNIMKLYEGVGALEHSFVFKIPVYENMPSFASPYPTPYEIALTPPKDYVKVFQSSPTLFSIWVDGIEYPALWNTAKQAVVYLPDQSASSHAKSAILYQYDEKDIPIGLNIWLLSYSGNTFTMTEQPMLQDLLTYHGFSIRISGKNGIRVKTGISTTLRAKLLADGVAGYRLKEYGTLVMNHAARTTYPFIKGGQKVQTALSYGMTQDGLRDAVFETVGGRYRYTVVFVNLPVSEYKTDFAFRGYMTLTDGDNEITLYGPITHRSIYRIAEQVLEQALYTTGSPQDIYLRTLIADYEDYAKTGKATNA